MENLQKQDKLSEYNNEPVYYCSRCLSLKVMRVLGVSDLDYCDKCGSTLIELCHIEEWLEKFKKRYGFDYINNNLNNNGR